MRKIKKGFTMIELLIVIAVLGILAVAVLSAINPIEQINRGKDTGSRSDAEQLVSAVDRFYTVNGYYPWQLSANPVDNIGIVWSNTKDLTAVLQNLSNAVAEIKMSFVTRISVPDYNSLWLYNNAGQGESTYVCFAPKSNSFTNESLKRCVDGLPTDIYGVARTTICDAGVPYSCLP